MPDNDIDIQEEIRNWNTRIEEGINKRIEHEHEAKKNYEAVYGDLSPYKENTQALSVEEERYKHFKTLSFLKTELPNLMFESPEIFLKHKKKGLQGQELIDVQEQTRKTQEEAQRIYSEMDGYEEEVEAGLIDAYCWYAVSKTTFSPLYVDNPEKGQPIVIDGIPTQEAQPDWKLSDLAFQRPRVDPFKMFFDSECKGNPNKGAFLGEEIDTNLERIKADAVFDEGEVNKLNDFLKLKRGNTDKKDWEIEITLYEVYNLLDDTMFVLVKGYTEDYLRKPTSTPMLGIEKHPYRILRFFGRPGEIYPFPEVSSLRRKQAAMNDLGEWAHEWAEKQRPVIGVDETKFRGKNKEKEMKKIGDGRSDVIEMKEGGAFTAVPDLPDNVSHKEYRAMLQNDFDEDAGQTTTERAGVESKEFAIQYEISQLKGQARESRKVKKVKKWLTGDIENTLKLMKANMPESFVMPSGFSVVNLNPDVDIDIDIESKTPKNRAIERKQLGEIASVQPLLVQSPTFMKAFIQTFESIRERDQIMNELISLLENPPEDKGTEPRLSINLSPKWEFMEEENKQVIMGAIMQYLGIELPAQTGGNGDNAPPASPNASVAEGTEGIQPGGVEEGVL